MAKGSKKNPLPASEIDPSSLFKLFMQGLEIRTQPDASINGNIPVDMYLNDHCVVIEAELPGVKQEEMELTFFKNSLIVKAVKYECFDDKDINYVCMERAFGKMTRTIDLPVPINSAKIRAVYKNGILLIEMPRVEDKRGQPKPIPIEFDKSEDE